TAYYGLAVGLPNIAFLSTGVWAALNLGFAAVFWIAAAGPLVGALAAAGIWLLAGDGTAASATGGSAAASGTGHTGAGTAAAAPEPTGFRLYRRLGIPLLAMLVPSIASSVVLTFLSIPLAQYS